MKKQIEITLSSDINCLVVNTDSDSDKLNIKVIPQNEKLEINVSTDRAYELSQNAL